MTLRVYKEEYQPRQIDYLKSHFQVVSESKRILTISASEAELEKVMEAMYSGEARFKSIFPDFMTEQERINYTHEKFNACVSMMQTSLLEMINNGVCDWRFEALRQAYFTLTDLKK